MKTLIFILSWIVLLYLLNIHQFKEVGKSYDRDVAFVKAITGSDRFIPISREDFAARFPQRGTDFVRW